MDNELKQKVYKFKKSIFNLIINVSNIAIIIATLVSYFIFIGYIVLFAGFSMWIKPNEISVPSYYFLSEEGVKKSLYFEKIEDDSLKFIMTFEGIELNDTAKIFTNLYDCQIDQLYANNLEIQRDNYGYYVIPGYTNKIQMHVTAGMSVDANDNYKAISLNVTSDFDVSLSSQFRIDSGYNQETNKYTLITADSIGEYKHTLLSGRLYQGVTNGTWIATIFTLLNVTKMITFAIILKKN